MKPKIRRVAGLWFCGESPRHVLGEREAPCGFSPKQAFEAWRMRDRAQTVTEWSPRVTNGLHLRWSAA